MTQIKILLISLLTILYVSFFSLMPLHATDSDTAYEYIFISIGDISNSSSLIFWEALIEEHGINPDGRPKLGQPVGNANAFFEEKNGRYIPRSVFVDLDPGIVKIVDASSVGTLFNEHNYVIGEESAGNNWAKGRYSKGTKLISRLMTIIEEKLKNTDNPGGVLLFENIGGQTSPGMGSLLLTQLKNDHPDLPIVSIAVLPSPKVSDAVVEPYNAVLSLHSLVQHADLVFLIDNEALYDISWNNSKTKILTQYDLDSLTAIGLSHATAQLRSDKVTGVEELIASLNCTERLKFVMISMANIPFSGALLLHNSSVTEMFLRIKEQFNLMFKRKAFLHWYTNEGATEKEFVDAENTLSNLISEYSKQTNTQE